MRFSYEWLCELAGIDDLTPSVVANRLTMAGFNVEEIASIDLSGIVVGRVLAQDSHPSSRKPLWIHQVDLGSEQRQIIAGIDNAVPGSLVPVALPGVTVPGGTTVRDGKIAGVETRGMLCAESELGLPEQQGGIMILEEGQPGQPLTELFPNDAILEVEVPPNRPDCQGHMGLARELAAASQRSLGRDFMPLFTGGIEPKGTDLLSVNIEEPELCSRYIGAIVSNVKVGSSPRWLQRRLQACGVRPINNVVDITNYVLLEYGQPLHAFDFSRITARQIKVRRAEAGESLLCLDGQRRELNTQTLVIADAQAPVAIAGVIGGQESAVTEGTTELLLEAANFDGVNIRATSRFLRLRTEASSRFEKGLSPELALAGARRAVGLLAELAGGEVHSEWCDEYPRPQESVDIVFSPTKIESILGVQIPHSEIADILGRLEFQLLMDSNERWEALPPVYRLDIKLVEDLSEEVGRIYGYDKIPATLPGSHAQRWHPPTASAERKLDPLRNLLMGAGFTEVVGVALVSSAMQTGFELPEREMRVVNPISDEHNALRMSLFVTLLQAAALNQQRLRRLTAFFEVGRAYLRCSEESDGQPEEELRLALISPAGNDEQSSRTAFLALKGAFERAVSELGVHVVTYRTVSDQRFAAERSGKVIIDGQPVGEIGELSPELLQRFDLSQRMVGLEVAVSPLLEPGKPRRYQPLPRYPAVSRDLAVIVEDSLPAANLVETVSRAGGELLEEVLPFDEYRGEQVGAGQKSVALALTFRSPERTLTDQEVGKYLDQVRGALRYHHNAEFRS